jgi:hypothetical protein
VKPRKLVGIALLFLLVGAWAGTARADILTGLPQRAVTAQMAWGPAASATIHPGVQTFTNGAQCTANFVFSNGVDVFIGQAAHCSGTGGQTATDGCTSGSLPLGTKVDVGGASHPGTMVYNSWLAMQKAHEKDANTCAGNDLALIKLDRADGPGRVNPSIPFWGGPNGVNTAGTTAGDFIYTYGNSELRLGLTELSPKIGLSLGDANGGWTHNVYSLTPGIPGDSGSAVLDSSGKALGILSTIEFAPMPASNQFGDLGRELHYMRTHSAFGSVQLATGTETFSPLV